LLAARNCLTVHRHRSARADLDVLHRSISGANFTRLRRRHCENQCKNAGKQKGKETPAHGKLFAARSPIPWTAAGF
jgi:hypothetical protein